MDRAGGFAARPTKVRQAARCQGPYNKPSLSRSLARLWLRIACSHQRIGRPDGDHAPAYLARDLYPGVLSEADMLGFEGVNVRFRYRDGQRGELRTPSLPGADFLWLLLAHVLPRGFRRCRSYGLLYHRRNILLQRVQLMLRVVLPPAEPRTRGPLLCRRCRQPIRIRPAAPTRPRIECDKTPTPAEGHGTV